jgi:hypothetical protein
MHNATIQQVRLQESPRQRECEETSLRHIACFSPRECLDWKTSRICKILPEQSHPPSRRPPHTPSIWRGTLGYFLILVLGLGLLVQQSFAQENPGERLPDVTPPLPKPSRREKLLAGSYSRKQHSWRRSMPPATLPGINRSPILREARPPEK